MIFPSRHLIEARLALNERGIDAALDLLSTDDVDSLNLRAWLLLLVGKVEQAGSELTGRVGRELGDAETKSLLALVRLSERRVIEATTLAEDALSGKPSWERVRMNAAIVFYYATTPESQLPRAIPLWPRLVVPTEFLIASADAITRTRQAAGLFRQILEDTESSPPRRQLIELWALGALGNSIADSSEAVAYASNLLSTPHPNYRALVWVLHRELPIPIDSHLATLRDLVAKSDDKELLFVLADCYITLGRSDDAILLLKEHESDYSQGEELPTWLYWLTHAHAAKGDFSSAQAVLASHRDRVDTNDLSELAGEALEAMQGLDDPTVLANRFESSQNTFHLFQAARAAAHAGDFEYVATHFETLVRRFPSSFTYTLAATSLYNTKRYTQALDLVDNIVTDKLVVPISPTLLRVRVLALEQLGRPQEAISEARALVEADRNAANLETLMQLLFTNAHIDEAGIVARELLDQDEATPKQLLGAAYSLAAYKTSLASDLWDRAKAIGIPGELTVPALTLGYRLGKKGEQTAFLVAQMQERGNAGAPDVKVYSPAAAMEALRQRSQQVGNYNALYRDGAVPVHLLSEALNVPLAVTHRETLQDNAELGPHFHKPIFIRHGSRIHTGVEALDKDSWRINLDVTALLIAHHLGILPLVETTFAEIRVSSNIVALLTTIINDLADPDPQRTELQKRIRNAVDTGAIAVRTIREPEPASLTDVEQSLPPRAAAMYSEAARNKWYVVDYLPLRSWPNGELLTSLPSYVSERGISAARLVESLRPNLTQADYQRAVEAFGPKENYVPIGPEISLGATLLINGLIAETLADGGILPLAARTYHLIVSEEYDRSLKAALRDSDRRARLATWVEELEKHVGDAKRADTRLYRPMPQNQAVAVDIGKPTARSLSFRILSELVTFPSDQDDLVWCDDRFSNALIRTDGGNNLVVGVSEILRILRHRGKLTDRQYFDNILVLRRGGAYFIPIDVEEILWHLNEAAKPDAFEETAELVSLRRYVAGALGLSGHTRPVRPDAGVERAAPNEVVFFGALAQNIRTAIVELFKQREQRVAAACADWLLHNLYYEDMLLYGNLLSNDSVGAEFVADNALATLYLHGVDIASKDASSEAQQHGLVIAGWASSRFLTPRGIVDPDASQRVMHRIKAAVVVAAQRPNTPDMDLARGLRVLPKKLQVALLDDRDLEESSGISAARTRLVEDVLFNEDSYLRGALNARRSGKSALATSSGEEATLLDVSTPSRIAIGIKIGDRELIDDDRTLVVTALDEAECKSQLAPFREALDFSDADLDSFAMALMRTDDPVRRLEFLRETISESPVTFYRNLAHHITMIGSADELLPDSPQTLLRYISIPPDISGDTTARFDNSAERLATAFGLEEAVTRLGRLPIPLPQTLVGGFADLDEVRARGLFASLLKMHRRNPVLLSHLGRLAALRGWNRSALSVCRSLRMLTRTDIYTVFDTVAGWAVAELCRWQKARAWTPTATLAAGWQHGSIVFDAAISAMRAGKPLRIRANDSAARYEDPLYARHDLLLDCAHPRNITPDMFFALSVAYIVSGTNVSVDRELASQFLESLTEELGEQRELASFTFRDAGTLPDALGSWLGARRQQAFQSVVALRGGFGALSPRRIAGLARKALNVLADDPNDAFSWEVLFYVYGEAGPRSKGIRARTASALSHASLATVDGAIRRANIAYIFACWAADLGGEELERNVTVQIHLMLPADIESQPADQQIAFREGPMVTALQLCSHKELGSRFDSFAGILTDLSNKDLRAYSLYRPLLETLRRRADPSRASALESVLLAGRGLA